MRFLPRLANSLDRNSCFLICLGSLGLFLGFPNPLLHFPLAGLFPAFCLMGLLFYESSPRKAMLKGWLMGLLGQSACLYWLTVPMCDVGGLPLALAIPTVLLLGSVLGAFMGASALCLYWLKIFLFSLRAGAPLGMPSSWPAIAWALFSGLALGGMELALSCMFTGFPWVTLAAGFVAWPLFIQAASIVGAYGVTALLSMAACLAAVASHLPGTKKVLPFILALCLVLALPLYGVYRIDSLSPSLEKHEAPRKSIQETATQQIEGGSGQGTRTSLAFGLIQGNIDQNQKWVPEFQRDTLLHYMTLSDSLLALAAEQGKTVDLLLWPETSMPFYFQNAEPFASIIRHFARKHGVPVGFGTLGYARDAQREVLLFNRFQTVSANGITAPYYDKQHLVPFGEYIPFPVAFAFLQNILRGMSFSPGNTAQPIELGTLLPGKTDALLGVLICYEAIFPEIAQKQVASGASVLINISNDAWFGNTSAPAQHLALTAMRAVEQRRPIVRATNTGYTACIDPLGRIQQIGPLFSDHVMLAEVLPENAITPFHTLYAVINGILLAGLIIPVCCGGYTRVRKQW